MLILNSKILQIRGKAELLEDIDRDQAYTIKIDGEITDVREPSNEDGTFDRVYIFNVARAEVVDQLGKTTKTKDARKMSQKVRAVIRHEWENANTDKTEEDYYQDRMKGIMRGIIEGKI